MILLCVLFTLSPAARWLESQWGLAALFMARGPIAPPDDVVILAITPQTADALNLPRRMTEWSREVYSRALVQLHQAEAKSVIFDIFFEGPADPAGDQQFETAIRQADNVVLFAWLDRTTLSSGEPLQGRLISERILEPWPPFAHAAKATAPHILPRSAGTVERFLLLAGLGHPRPTLPVVALQLTGQPSNLAIETARSKSLMFNFYGPAGTLTTVAFDDYLLNPLRFRPLMAGASVWIGFASSDVAGQQDSFETIYSRVGEVDLSGVELAGTAFANLRDERYLKWVPLAVQWSGMLLLASLFSLLSWRFRPSLALRGLAVLGLIYLTLSYVLFSLWQLWLPWVIPVAVMLPLLAVAGLRLNYWHEVAHRQRLTARFRQYVPAEEVNRLLAGHGQWPQQRAQKGLCLVTDAAGFTPLAERLPAEVLIDVMVSYYDALISPIREREGLISDVAGDGVIAVWGDVTPAEAVNLAQELTEALTRRLSAFAHRYPNVELPTRLGFHWGEWVIGHFGASDHFEFRAVGDLVNTTARIEGLNKTLNTQVLISAQCGVANHPLWRYVGRFLLVGKRTPLAIFTRWEPGMMPEPDVIQRIEMRLAAGELNAVKTELQDMAREYPGDGPLQFWLAYLQEAADLRPNQLLPVRLTQK